MSYRTFYWHALDRGNQLLHHIGARLKPFYCTLQQKNNHGVFAVNINARVGFFAQLNWCLYIFAHCERHNLRPYIILSSPFYTRSQGDNWLHYFFDNLALTNEDCENIESGAVTISNIEHIEQLGLPWYHLSKLSIENGHHLLNKYLTTGNEIERYVDTFVKEYFSNRKILAVHYRGTDKGSEAKPVSRSFCVRTVCNYLDSHPEINGLFVSSDEESFLEYVNKEVKQVDVFWHNDIERSVDGSAIHSRPDRGDNYMKGKEALINCLLLSRSDVIIRTASFLSAWSSVFNPSLPVIMLNNPYDHKLWFPDREIIKRSMKEYLPNST